MSSISGISSNAGYWAQMQTQSATGRTQQLAQALFSQIDTTGRGSFNLAQLQAALEAPTSTASSSTGTGTNASSGSGGIDVNTLFSQLDTNGDGTVTQQEFTSAVQKLAQSGHVHHSHPVRGGGVDADGDHDGSTSAETSAAATNITTGGTTASGSITPDPLLLKVMQAIQAYATTGITPAPSGGQLSLSA